MTKTTLAAALAAALLFSLPASAPVEASDTAPAAADLQANPFLQAEWATPFGAVPFDRIRPEHFVPAFDAGMAAHLREIDAIAKNPAAPDFANTIVAMERAGRDLDRVGAVFFNMTSANSSDAIRAIQTQMAPRIAAHQNAILLNPALFARVEAVHANRANAGLDAEQIRLVERHHLQFQRAGAALTEAQRERVAAIGERMASLSSSFQQNLMKDTDEWALFLDEAQMAGVPAPLKAAAAAEAKTRGQEGKFAITLQRPSVEPFLTFAEDRALREQAWRAWTLRGDNNDGEDNKGLIAEIVALRAERAQIMGYDSHAEFTLDDTMAKTPEAALELMRRVWEPALARAKEERADMQALITREGGDYALQGWDWRYYAEQVRKERFDISQDEIRPYFQLEQFIAAQFYLAKRLFGLEFTERKDLPVYHPSVRVWEVKDAAGQHVGLFYGDYFARQGKSGGAWMSSYRAQEKFDGAVTPHIVNVMNIPAAPEGEIATISLDDAITLFHEMGHGLHGLMSDVNYPSLAGTAVSRDFVEFPAQILEHYVLTPHFLNKFATHKTTGASMPVELQQRLIASRQFNQGFATVEFLSSGFVDMDFHALTAEQAKGIDVAAFEAQALERIGAIPEIPMRHRSPHFAHIFAGGYSAGYYSYLWSEVLDSDGFDAFSETGDLFNPEVAARLKQYVFSAGNLRDPMAAYVAFRGREPVVEPLLRNRGFLADGDKRGTAAEGDNEG
ncbi:M3 family metallopeptidase [Silanimonas sp.]|uniref:M3 family metallopeptidase n=1 Tax=Silanimonas sp. TaxID=1929290 RepID=UPI0037CB9DF0